MYLPDNHIMIGTGVSPGISIGTACILKKADIAVSGITANENEKQLESERFDGAVRSSINEIESIKADKFLNLNSTDLEILDTQIEFLNDGQIREDVISKIFNESKIAEEAVIEVINAAVEMFRNMDDEYLSARAADVEDTGNRILSHLKHGGSAQKREFRENTIIIADDILPSETITLDISKIAGIATRLGGRTSHAAIIARTKGIPAVVACGEDLMNISDGDPVILDGSTGEVIVNPDIDTVNKFRVRQKNFAESISFLKSVRDLPAITKDGHKINLYANISNAGDLEQVFENGGEGVGLFRTEMLLFDRSSLPSEEEQFQFYKQVAIRSKNKPVVCRTFDIGGDKQLPCLEIPQEANPFLGYRAIRICLDQEKMFLTQLKAILRAAVYGNLKIMFPMISNINELRSAKDLVKKAKEELIASEVDFRNDIETGIMIEIPAAAIMVDILAKESDFFSIGTNDLCMYTLAVDRMNRKVSGLYNHFHPAVLRLIQQAINEAHKQNKHIGMCGEMASDPLATLLLLGMGLDEFSMSAGSIPFIKNIIINHTLEEASQVLQRVMEMDNAESITKYLQDTQK